MSGCRGEIEADDEIPRIFVRCLGDDIPELVQYIEHGIEEEGVSWVVQNGYDGDSVTVAHGASHDSSLKVGVSVRDSHIIIHHKQLPDDDPLFDVDEASAETARKLGANSARLAKKTPLKPIG